MTFLALLAPMIPAKVEDKVAGPPTFKPKWWYSANKLDARPVIWSLENHPEEWEAAGNPSPGQSFNILHKPSQHLFWVSSVLKQMNLRDGDHCSCQGRAFQLGQSRTAYFAAQQWLYNSAERGPTGQEISDQFVSHFVR